MRTCMCACAYEYLSAVKRRLLVSVGCVYVTKTCQTFRQHLILIAQYRIRPHFFCISLTRVSCMRPAGKNKKRYKNTLSTRGCSVWVSLNTRGGLTRAPLRKNPHPTRDGAVLRTTEHERVPYTHDTRCSQRYKSTYTH